MQPQDKELTMLSPVGTLTLEQDAGGGEEFIPGPGADPAGSSRKAERTGRSGAPAPRLTWQAGDSRIIKCARSGTKAEAGPPALGEEPAKGSAKRGKIP